MERPTRKRNRLDIYDYSMPNAYFVTICTVERKNLFWANDIQRLSRPQDVRLSPYGEIVDRTIHEISNHYPSVSVDHYAVMPNHIHLLLQIHTDGDGQPVVAPSISRVIKHMKGAVTRQAGIPVWQKGFYDHVIRGEKEYQEIWNYIERNPMKWNQDELYRE